MEENINDNISQNSDALIEDREEQKKLVHPYRKYQLYIISMFILMIILSLILYRQNNKLKEYLKKKDLSISLLTSLEKESRGTKQLMELIDVNYQCINKLDERRNIDILKFSNEIFQLSSFIANNDIITYENCYKTSEDGDSPLKFIEKCSKLSPLVFLIETNEGYRFAIYISQFLNYDLNDGKGGYIYDNKAFIYSLDTNRKYDIKQPEYAIYIQRNDFPWFGQKDVFIGKDFTRTYSSFCDYPVAFERNEKDKGDYILNGGVKKFIIKEMEVLSPSIWDFESP